MPAPPPPPSSAPRRFRRLRSSRAWRWGRWPLGALAVLGTVGVVGLAYLYATTELPDEPPQVRSSVVLDAKGRELAILQKDELRVEVPLDEVAPVVVDALVAAEDRDFYDHDGIDPRGIVRAVRNNLGGGPTQGGSTITQQLVKNEHLSGERSMRRKVREAILAVKLERSADKDEILERYLNTVYFGRGAYGIEAAARVYFDQSAAELTLPQAALLVGLLTAPERAEPTEHPDVALERRASVLADLVEVGDITQAEADEAAATDLGALPRASSVTLRAGVGAHVVEHIRREAVERFGESAVHGGGLTITTSIDIDLQRAAEVAVSGVLDQPEDPEAALVAVDAFGAVRAHVGGRDFERLQVDLALGAAGGGSGRQAGSAFKPFVLAAALDDGTATLGSPYRAPGQMELETPGGPWTVRNYGGGGYGVIDLNEATVRSANTPYAQLVLDVGPARAAEVAQRLGISGELGQDPSLVLGTAGVSVLDMAGSYATLGRDGLHVEPFHLVEVRDGDGRLLYEADPSTTRAVQEGTARAVNHALQGVVERGTATSAQLDRPIAGKTGTTQGHGDAWFVGYTPSLAAAVWMGYPEGPQRAMTDVRGGAVTGGSLPVEIWRAFMAVATDGTEPEAFPEPPPELLERPPLPEVGVAISPDRGPSGTVIEVRASGVDACLAGWQASLDPGGATATADGGEDADAEQVLQLTVPEGLGSGRARVTVSCDTGIGPEAVGEAWFEVDQPEPDPAQVAALERADRERERAEREAEREEREEREERDGRDGEADGGDGSDGDDEESAADPSAEPVLMGGG